MGLTPGRIGYRTVKACIKAGVDVVDLSFMPEDPLTLNEDALKADVTVIPDCGVAPGLCNILVGRLSTFLDEVEDVNIFVGGIPEKPVPPLDYKYELDFHHCLYPNVSHVSSEDAQSQY